MTCSNRSFRPCLAFLFCVTMAGQSFAQEDRIPAKGYALFSKDGKFAPYEFDRHPVGDNDVLIDILYAGICHSDLHHARADWREESYPMVPGHEILGRVSRIGKNVTKFKIGDFAGVGCMVNSCGECEHCKKGEEQYCDEKRTVFTYASKDIYHGGVRSASSSVPSRPSTTR